MSRVAVKKSVRCASYTKSGLVCKNRIRNDSELYCHVHIDAPLLAKNAAPTTNNIVYTINTDRLEKKTIYCGEKLPDGRRCSRDVASINTKCDRHCGNCCIIPECINKQSRCEQNDISESLRNMASRTCTTHHVMFKFDREECCPICTDELSECEFPLSCGHWIHRECLHNWTSTCPVCRAPVELYDNEAAIIRNSEMKRARERRQEQLASDRIFAMTLQSNGLSGLSNIFNPNARSTSNSHFVMRNRDQRPAEHSAAPSGSVQNNNSNDNPVREQGVMNRLTSYFERDRDVQPHNNRAQLHSMTSAPARFIQQYNQNIESEEENEEDPIITQLRNSIGNNVITSLSDLIEHHLSVRDNENDDVEEANIEEIRDSDDEDDHEDENNEDGRYINGININDLHRQYPELGILEFDDETIIDILGNLNIRD